MLYNLEYTPAPNKDPFIIATAPDYERAAGLKDLYNTALDYYGDICIKRSYTLSELDPVYTGPDCNLETSLFEYGIAWDDSAYKEDPAAEVDFIIGSYQSIDLGGDHWGPGYTQFYRSNYDLSDFKDLFNKDSWCDIYAVASCSGLTIKQLYKGFPYTLYDFIGYYGIENFMPGPMWASQYFTIQDI